MAMVQIIRPPNSKILNIRSIKTFNCRSERVWQSPIYKGVILEFDPHKGYGYIQSEGRLNERICAHVSW
jgi:hypothetical protein